MHEHGRFEKLLEASDQLVLELEFAPEPRVNYISSLSRRLLGHTPEEFYRQPELFFSQIYPRDRERFDEAFQAPAVDKVALPLRFVRPDGNLVSLHAIVLTERDAQGCILSADVILRDVTEDQLIEEEQRDLLYSTEIERQWVNKVLKSSPVAMMLVRMAGGREECQVNQRFHELIPELAEQRPDSAETMSRLHDSGGKQIPRERNPTRRALAGEYLREEEYLLRAAGRDRPVRVNGAPIRDTDGEVRGAVIAIEDLSSLKKLEQLRREWQEVIAHDLRQPINTIQMFVSTLEAFPDFATQSPDRFARGIGWLKSSTLQLSRLVDDLVDFSKVEANTLRLSYKDFELGEMLQRIVESERQQAPERPIVLEGLSGAGPLLSADPVRLQQILSNLLSNAMKYGYPGTPIHVRCTLSADTVRVSIENEGEGILRRDLQKVFQRYVRTADAESSPIRGSGLGLYIARGLVEAHGGRIWAESEPGRKTVFTVVLPTSPGNKGAVIRETG